MTAPSSTAMQATAAYTVRAGYVYADVRQGAERVYAAGEQVVLPVALGDCAHQLERAAPSVVERALRKRPLQPAIDAPADPQEAAPC